MAVTHLCFLAWLPGVLSHGYMSKPTTRAELRCEAAGEPMWGGAGCLNHRSSATTNIHWPQLPGHVPGTGIIPEPVCSGPGSPMQQYLIDQLNTPGPVQVVYKQGQAIDVAFNIQANHKGKYSYRLCADGSDNEACFQRGQLKFTDGDTWKDVQDGTVTRQVRLPADVTCERCTLSGRWDAGKDENQVWVYCADIKIEGSGSTGPGPSPTPSPVGMPTPKPAGSCSATGDDCRTSKCCTESGLQCFEKNQWWGGCRANCAAGQSDPNDPPEYRTPWSCRLLDAGNGVPSPTPQKTPPNNGNLLLNYDFENGNIPFWNGKGALVTSEDAHSGTKSMKISGSKHDLGLYKGPSAPSRHWGRVWLKFNQPSGMAHATFLAFSHGSRGEIRVVDTVYGPWAQGKHQYLLNFPDDQGGKATEYHYDLGKWKCYEWYMDGPGKSYSSWEDGQVVINQFNEGAIPNDFPELRVGMAIYQDGVQGTVFIDDLAIDDERIGCELPTPSPPPVNFPKPTPPPTDPPMATPSPADTPKATPSPADTPKATPSPADTPKATPSPADTSKPSPGSIGRATVNLKLHNSANVSGDKVTLSFWPASAGKVRFEVQVNALGWIGFGISTGTEGLMIGGGQGADVVLCSDGQVKRYWMRSYAGPSDKDFSEDVEDASCNQANGYTTLMFTRTVAAASDMQRALTPGAPQPVVVAWGDGTEKVSYHNGKQGHDVVDFASNDFASADSLLSGARGHDATYALALVVFVIKVVLIFTVA